MKETSILYFIDSVGYILQSKAIVYNIMFVRFSKSKFKIHKNEPNIVNFPRDIQNSQ